MAGMCVARVHIGLRRSRGFLPASRLISRLLLGLSLTASAGDRLEMHFIDVGQGDAELLVSPGGQSVLVDGGLPGSDKVVNAYLQSHGITRLDYYIVSHYHNDHIGCAKKILTASVVSGLRAAYDRGDTPTNTDSYGKAFAVDYRTAVDGKRITASTASSGVASSHQFELDASSNQPVVIDFVAANGNGRITKSTTINENDLSVAFLVRFGQFSAVLGGDLSGSNGSDYDDIETSLASGFPGPVTLYKVHHHGSRYSSNTNWLAAINPVVGIICCGTRNNYGLPEDGALGRLADYKVDTYWTETGSKDASNQADVKGGVVLKSGLKPKVERLPDASKHQRVGGNIIVLVGPSSTTFDLVTDSPQTTNTYSLVKPKGDWGRLLSTPVGQPTVYVWSAIGTQYHVAGCPKAALLSAKHRQQGPVPPPGMVPHSCVKPPA
jgi:beta-lactamase superfamily II metal-dependent hydrolase